MVVTTNGSQVKRTETISQLKEDISKFYECYKKKYLAIRHKHIKEHKELRRLNDDKYGTGKRHFFFFFCTIILTSFDYSSRQKIVYLSVENLNGMYITRNSLVLFNYIQVDLIKGQKKISGVELCLTTGNVLNSILTAFIKFLKKQFYASLFPKKRELIHDISLN